MMRLVRAPSVLLAAALAFTVACQTNTSVEPTGTVPVATAQSYLQTVAAVNGPATTAGAFHTGAAPAPAGGPIATYAGPSTVYNGGGGLFRVTSATPFQHVYLAITTANAPVDGFWQVDLAAPATDQLVSLAFTSAIPASTFELRFQVASAAGTVGAVTPLPTSVTLPGSKAIPNVQVSVVPSPVPFLNGAPCTLQARRGCLWEFKLIAQEFNGIGVDPVTVTETYTFPGEDPIVTTLTTSLAPRSTTTIVRTVACDDGTAACATPGQIAGGTYTFTMTGADSQGNEFNLVGPVIQLKGR